MHDIITKLGFYITVFTLILVSVIGFSLHEFNAFAEVSPPVRSSAGSCLPGSTGFILTSDDAVLTLPSTSHVLDWRTSFNKLKQDGTTERIGDVRQIGGTFAMDSQDNIYFRGITADSNH